MNRHQIEAQHDRIQVFVAVALCVGVLGQFAGEVLEIAGAGRGPGLTASVVALAGWLGVVIGFVRMASLSKRDDGSWLDTITRDERTAVSRARAVQTGFGATLATALVFMLASGFVQAISVDFACSMVIGVGLAAATVRFVIENR